MSINLHFGELDWQRIERDWSAWWAGDLARPLVVIEDPIRDRNAEELTPHFLLEKPIDEVLDYHQARLESQRLYGDAWPKWWPFYGAGVVAAFLGSLPIITPETATIWFEPPASFDIENTELRFDDDNTWWQRIKALTEAAVQRWGEQVCVGFTDLGGNMDILASLRGSQTLMLDLYDHPDAVRRKRDEITRLWQEYYESSYAIIRSCRRGTMPWAPIWSPGRCYMLQSDFSAMLSPQMFEEFILPDIESCCKILDHSFYHLDGQGQISHLDMLLALPELNGIQWIPGDGAPPPEAWLPLLKRIRDGGKLCQLFVSAEGARTITKALGGRGFAFYILEPLSEPDATVLLADLTHYTNQRQ